MNLKSKINIYIKMLSILVTSVAVMACSSENEKAVVMKEIVREGESNNSDKATDITYENKVESVIDSKNEQSVSLDINGEKYKLLSPDFKAGSKVRNVLTNEIGTVMGSFYVSIEEKMELNKFNTRFKIKPLSNDTFEFIPLDRKAHLIEIYRELKLTPEFLHVEMNIMFLGSHDGDTKKQF